MILCKIIYKISRFLKFNESSHIIFLKVSNYKCIRFKFGKKSSRHDSKCEPELSESLHFKCILGYKNCRHIFLVTVHKHLRDIKSFERFLVSSRLCPTGKNQKPNTLLIIANFHKYCPAI